MKRLTRWAYCIVLSCGAGAAETPWTDRVEQMWGTARFDAVVQIANARLAKNGDDLPGLIVKLASEIESLKTSELKATIDRILVIGARFDGPKFRALYPRFVQELRAIQKAASGYSREQLERDRKKSGQVGKSLPFAEKLRALEQDGAVSASEK